MDILAAIPQLEQVHNDPNFIVFLESYLAYFITSQKTAQVAITDQQNGKYEGDFFGLLGELRVAPEYRYMAMRMNGLSSSEEYLGNLTTIIVPEASEFNRLKQVYMSKKKF